VTVELPKFKKTKKELVTILDKWLYSLKNMEYLLKYPEEEMNEKIFKELYENAKINNLTEKEMKAYQRSVLEYDDVILAVDYAEDRGKKQGINIGINIGRENELIKFVLNCYKRNMKMEEIAELTDLNVEQISAILSNQDN
jgi:predicted transposase/invertase (TIGR01784 family)